MKRFLAFAGLGLGLPLGLALTYSLYTNESARLVAALLGGYLLAVVTILLTVILVLRATRRDERVTYNQRYQLPPTGSGGLPPGDYWEGESRELLPPVRRQQEWTRENNIEDEVIA